jgi:hypothetical protein
LPFYSLLRADEPRCLLIEESTLALSPFDWVYLLYCSSCL